jgi:hypothetical protein
MNPNPRGGAADWLSPSKTVKFGQAIRAELEKDRHLTLHQLMKLTGAPMELSRKVRARWMAQHPEEP